MSHITTTTKIINPKYATLIDMVSHELKSPLTTLKIFAEILHQDIGSPAPDATNKYLDKIDAKVNQLTGMVNDYADLVRIQNHQIQFEDKPHHYTDLLTASLANINHHHPFNYKTGHSPNCQLHIDSDRFQQSLSKFIFHLLNRLAPEQDNIHIISANDNSRLIINILNPPRSVSTKDFQILPPGDSVDFYDDIEVTLAHAILGYYQGTSQLFWHQDYGYIFSLSLPQKA